MHSIPDATTVALFRERLRQAGVSEELFQMFDTCLDAQGLQAGGGPIIDATTIVPVPKQRNRRKENEEIKQGKCPSSGRPTPASCGKRTWRPGGPGKMT